MSSSISEKVWYMIVSPVKTMKMFFFFIKENVIPDVRYIILELMENVMLMPWTTVIILWVHKRMSVNLFLVLLKPYENTL